MNAFIFVIEAIIMTFYGVSAEKIYHLVLVKREVAAVAVGVFVVGIKFAALAICLAALYVFGKIKCHFYLTPEE